MDLNLIIQAQSGNQAALDTLMNAVSQAEQNPQFIFFLIQQIQTAQVQENSNVLSTLEIIIKNVIQAHFFSEPDESYWPEPIQQEIQRQIFQLSISVRSDLTTNLIPSLDTTFKRSFPKCAPLISQIPQAFDQYSNDINMLNVLISIIEFWSNIVRDKMVSIATNSEYRAQIQKINSDLLQKLLITVQSLSQQNTTNIEVVKLLGDICKEVTSLIISFQDPQLLTQVAAVFPFFGGLLNLDSSEEVTIHSKQIIAESLSNLFSMTFSRKALFTIDYINYFKSHLAPSIANPVATALSKPQSFFSRGALLRILNIFIFHRACSESLINPDTISQLLISSSRLTEAELSDFTENPNYYVDQYLGFTSVDFSDISPRAMSAEILASLVEKRGLKRAMYGFLTAPTQDFIEFESKIYLLTKYAKVTKNNHFPGVHPQYIEYLISIINTVPPFLLSTILLLLAQVIPYAGNCKPASALALQIIQNDSVNEVVAYCASKLLYRCLKQGVDAEGLSINTDVLFPKLLYLASIMTMPHPINALSEIAQLVTQETDQFIIPLSQHLIQLVISDVMNQENPYALHSFNNLIQELLDNSDSLKVVADMTWPAFLQLLAEKPDTTSLMSILDMLSVFCLKLDVPTEGMTASIPPLFQFFSQFQDDVFAHMRYVTYIVYPYVEILPPDVTVQLAGSALKTVMNDAELVDCNDQGYALFLASVVLLKMREQCLGFVDFAMQLLAGKQPLIVMQGIVSLLAAAALINAQQLAQALKSNEAIMSNFIEFCNYVDGESQPPQVLKSIVIVLIALVMSGVAPAYPVAAKFLLAMLDAEEEQEIEQKKAIGEEEDTNDEEEEDEEVPRDDFGDTQESAQEDLEKMQTPDLEVEEEETEDEEEDSSDEIEDESQLVIPKDYQLDQIPVIPLFVQATNSFPQLLQLLNEETGPAIAEILNRAAGN